MAGWDKPKVAVLGAGAMGSMFGGLLGAGGLEVTLIDIWAEHVAAVRARGLRLVGDEGERMVPVSATTEPSEAGEADVVLVHCKAYHTTAAVEAARGLFGADTVAISFQNGLGNEEAIGEVIGIERVLGGTTAQGASLLGPGAVRYYGDLPSQIGELAGGVSDRAERIADALSGAGLQTTASTEIRRDIWRKLLANVALGALSALADLTIAELMTVPALKASALAALDEAARRRPRRRHRTRRRGYPAGAGQDHRRRRHQRQQVEHVRRCAQSAQDRDRGHQRRGGAARPRARRADPGQRHPDRRDPGRRDPLHLIEVIHKPKVPNAKTRERQVDGVRSCIRGML